MQVTFRESLTGRGGALGPCTEPPTQRILPFSRAAEHSFPPGDVSKQHNLKNRRRTNTEV